MDPRLVGLTQYPLARRGFVMTSLMSGLTMATAHAQSPAQAIHTDTAGLVAGEVQVPVTDGHVPTYRARPEGDGPFPTILVIEEIFGVHEYIKDVCVRLAKLGYLALAPELYARLADMSKITDPKTLIRDVISKAPDATVLSDLDATAAWAEAHHGDPARLGVTGFCRGGRDTWLYAAHNPHLRAAVAWYGPLGGPTSAIQPRTAGSEAGEIKCPLLALYGGLDPSIPEADRKAALARATAAGKTVVMHVYPDAAHGFHADYRPSYNAADAKDGWARMLAWFRKYGVA